MILGIGTDIVEIDRIRKTLERHGEGFYERVCTPNEISACKEHKDPAPRLAARFAAKEAVSKAFGTGIGNGISLKDIEVVRREGERPEIRLHGKTREMAESIGVSKVHLSLSHDAGMAVAFVVLER